MILPDLLRLPSTFLVVLGCESGVVGILNHLQCFPKTLSCTILKKKTSPVNNVFLGESSKLHALLSCACCASTVLCYGLMSKIPALDLPSAYQNNSNGASVEVPAIPQSLRSMFELLLILIHPSKCICTPNQKQRI